jgi:ribosomal protein S18 acetylase RimI-like enzyme
MSTHSAPYTPAVDRLGPADVAETIEFLDADPVLHVYAHALVLRDALARPRDEWWGARRAGRLTALLYLGAWSGAVLPVGEDPDGLRALGDVAATRREALPPRFQVIGPRDAVAAVRERFPAAGPRLRLERDQIYMALEPAALAATEPLPALRPARREDYALVHETGAALRAEELLEDPRTTDPIAYARRAEEDCRDGQTFVWRDARGLVFRASISARTTWAAQISGVYTAPALRGRGVATRALGELCRRLFERSGSCCLFVNTINAPAIAVYRRLGFVERSPWASAFYEPDA